MITKGERAPTALCPVCGKPTAGTHIAGVVYDFTCDPCAELADRKFRAFVRRAADEIEAEIGGTS